MKKKQTRTVGSIVKIDLHDGTFILAQILNDGLAFFDYRSNVLPDNLNYLIDTPVLFILSVYNDVITQGRWLKVGKLPIRQDLQNQPLKFIQDTLEPEKFELYDPNNGDIIAATKNQCVGLEAAAVWEAEHVESRIIDHYNKVPNIWVEQLKIK